MTGFGANQADLRTGVPVLVQQAVVDKVTGLTAAQAITAALFERDRTGRGQVIEVPMLHAGLSFLWPDVTTNVTMQGDFDKLPPQSRTFRLTPTADGYVAMITVTTPQWNGLLRATGRDDLVGHADYDSPQQRGRNGGPLMKEIGAQLATLTTAEVTARLTEQGVPHAAVTDLADLPAVDRDASPPATSCARCTRRWARCSTRGPAVTFDEVVTVRPAPGLGEHTDEIKAELEALSPPDLAPVTRRVTVPTPRPSTVVEPMAAGRPASCPRPTASRSARLRAFWARRSSPTVGMMPDG